MPRLEFYTCIGVQSTDKSSSSSSAPARLLVVVVELVVVFELVVRVVRHAQIAPPVIAHLIIAVVAELDTLDRVGLVCRVGYPVGLRVTCVGLGLGLGSGLGLGLLVGGVWDPLGFRVTMVLAHALEAEALLLAPGEGYG